MKNRVVKWALRACRRGTIGQTPLVTMSHIVIDERLSGRAFQRTALVRLDEVITASK